MEIFSATAWMQVCLVRDINDLWIKLLSCVLHNLLARSPTIYMWYVWLAVSQEVAQVIY